MRIKLSILAAIVPLALDAQSLGNSLGSLSETPYQIINSGPHERLWQKVTVDAQGITNTRSYTEIATGLNFWNPATEKWESTREEFAITADGYAIATNGQHQT